MDQFELPLEYFDLVECGGKLNHHLRRKPSGLWQMRITVDRGPKYVGKRVTRGLKTRCVHEARIRRDLILDMLIIAEKISSEGQKRVQL